MCEVSSDAGDSHSGNPDADIFRRQEENTAFSPKAGPTGDLPKITIITPSYNQCGYIEQTIESVFAQRYPNLEYLVVDGGSSDGTLDILRRYGDRLQWVSEPDHGQSHAINKGLKKASGEVVGFLNSDDLYEPGALRVVGTWFRRNPAAMWATGYCRNIDADGAEIRKAVALYKRFWLTLNCHAALQVLNFVSQPATFWRRDVMKAVGFLDEGLQFAMDYDYWLRIGRRYPLRVIRASLARYRIHPASKAGSSINAQFDSEMEIARKHVRSKVLLGLHALHRMLIITFYHSYFLMPIAG